MNIRRETFTRTLPFLTAGAVCITGLSQESSAQNQGIGARESVSMNTLKAEDFDGGTGGVAGLAGTTDCPLTENFETFPIGIFSLIGGWTGTTFGGNMFIVQDEQENVCLPIEGTKSALHASDGTTIVGFELDSPNFGPCFDPITMQMRRTEAPNLDEPATISTYQLVSLDNGSGFFNTRVQFEPDGAITVGQLDTMEEPPVFVFFNTGLTWEQDTVYQICIDLAEDGDLNVFVDAELALSGLSASKVGIDEGLGDPGDVYEGHGQYRTLCDNVGLGVVEAGADGDTTDDRATCEGDNLMLDAFGIGCGGVIQAPCPGDTNGDGAVNSDDLVNTILCFGTDGIADEDGGECDVLNSGDNADSVGGPSAGVVDSDDIVSGIILNWGLCPVVNDECDDAVFLFFPGAYEFNTTGATLAGGFADPACASPGDVDADIFYKFVLSCDADALTITAQAGNPDYNPVLEVFEVTGDDECVDLAAPVCDNDGAGGNDAVVTILGATEATEFLIRVSGEDPGGLGFFDQKGPGTLLIEVDCQMAIPPLNDDCINATPLVIDDPAVEGQTNTASADDEAFNCALSGGGPGVWYSFVGDGSELTVTMCNGAVFDSTVQVYCGTPTGTFPSCEAGLECIGGDDDGCGMPGDGTVSSFTFCSQSGRPYLVRVSGFLATDTGNFSIEVTSGLPCPTPATCEPPPDTPNDDCAGQISIFQGLTPFNTLDATTDGPAHPDGCPTAGDGGATVDDIWFRYTAEITGVIQVSTCSDVTCPAPLDCEGQSPSSTHDSDIVIYEGTDCDEADLLQNFIGCSDDDAVNTCGTGAGGFQSTALVPVEAGTEYLIRLGSWFTEGAGGTGDLLLVNFLPTEDLCDFALPVDADGVAVALDELDNAAADPGAALCPTGTGVVHDAPGIWLVTEGDGDDFRVTVCSEVNNPCSPVEGDIRITVYCGPCAELACVADTRDENADLLDLDGCVNPNQNSEQLTWRTFPGQPYYILVENVGTLGGCGWEAVITDLNTQNQGDPPCFGPDECGGESAQPRRLVDDAWLFGTTDLGAGFLRYDNFAWDGGDITGLRVWGIDARFIPGVGFSECDDPIGTPTLEYQIQLWDNDDNGTPGDATDDNPDYFGGGGFGDGAIATWDFDGLDQPVLSNADEYGGLPFQNYAFDFDVASVNGGPFALGAGNYWLSVQDTDNNVCFFLWLDSRIGDDRSKFDVDINDGGGTLPENNDRDFSFCFNPTINLTPKTGACCVGTNCTVNTNDDCEVLGGTWDGGDDCVGNPCD